MPKWQIDGKVYFDRLNLSAGEFRGKLHLPDVAKVKKVIPLKDMGRIDSLIPTTLEMVTFLIRRIRTVGGDRPFSDADIRMVKMDPRQLKIGQRYVYREKYQGLLEEVPDIFHKFSVTNGGLADLAAYFVFGLDGRGDYSMACYMPPMVEKHGPDIVIMDGIHRNYLLRQSGMTLNVILIEGVTVPFPCGMREWDDVKVIPSCCKPAELGMRYFELKQELFRDLKYLGIDG